MPIGKMRSGFKMKKAKAKKLEKHDPLCPSVPILIALGSIAVHVDEAAGPGGHAFDTIAARSALETPGLRQWLEDMGPLLPVKRM